MLSLRAQLAKLERTPTQRFRYSDFILRPRSLRTAMRSMDTPGQFRAVPVPADREHDTWWAEEAQGIALVDQHWIISSNPLWTSPAVKALYTFPLSSKFRDDDVVHKFEINDESVPDIPGGIFHVGNLMWQDGFLWVDHWNEAPSAQVLKFRVTDGVPTYVGHVPLRHDRHDRVVLVAIDRWSGRFITGPSKTLDPPPSFGSPSSQVPEEVMRRQPAPILVGAKLFIHDANGDSTGIELPLDPPISDRGYLQGGFVSPNGHIYVSSGRSGKTPRQYIYGYHALTGRRFASIEVVAEETNQELEGCSYVSVDWNGFPVRLVAVLLENERTSYDDAFLKAFVAERPDDV